MRADGRSQGVTEASWPGPGDAGLRWVRLPCSGVEDHTMNACHQRRSPSMPTG